MGASPSDDDEKRPCSYKGELVDFDRPVVKHGPPLCHCVVVRAISR
jgi:hypothetical protein